MNLGISMLGVLLLTHESNDASLALILCILREVLITRALDLYVL